jgi:hypothetical protein
MFEIIRNENDVITAKIVADDPLEFWDILKDYVWTESILKLNFDYTSPDCCVGEVVFSSYGLQNSTRD